jgi:hypothetical protein
MKIVYKIKDNSIEYQSQCGVCGSELKEKVFKEDNEWCICCSEFCHSIRRLRNLDCDTYTYDTELNCINHHIRGK